MRVIITFLLFGSWLAGQASAEPVDTDTLAKSLQSVLDREVASSTADAGVMTSVIAPGLNLRWSGSAGNVALESAHPLAPNQPFRIASITKVFTAATVFRLAESGRLQIHDPIAPYISAETANALRSGGYDPNAMRIQQLLAHTSGLYDYAMDPKYMEAVGQDGHRRWTRAEQISFAMRNGKPVGAPGERYAYSDTGYVILGEIIERSSGNSLPAAVRKYLKFDVLGIHSTYFESLEPAPDASLPRAHQYLGDLDVTDFDPSFDLYGGGGLVSTTEDVAAFFVAMFGGKLFERPSTLASALMTVPSLHTQDEFPHANLLTTIRFGERSCWAHGGFWGSIAVYCPDADLAVAITTNVAGSRDRMRRLVAGLSQALNTRDGIGGSGSRPGNETKRRKSE